MSKVLSLKLKEEIFHDAEEVVRQAGIPRNTYINQAVAFYTRLYKNRILKQQLIRASKAVASDSMKVLKEFEAFTEDFQ